MAVPQVRSREEILALKEKIKNWTVVYPHYLSKNLTTADGRRLPKTQAVTNPTIQEIAIAARSLGFDVVIEGDKGYARDILHRGRLRVCWWELPNEQEGQGTANAETKKTPRNLQIASKLQLLKSLAESVEKSRGSVSTPSPRESSSANSQPSASKNKKKNKKKKKN